MALRGEQFDGGVLKDIAEIVETLLPRAPQNGNFPRKEAVQSPIQTVILSEGKNGREVKNRTLPPVILSEVRRSRTESKDPGHASNGTDAREASTTALAKCNDKPVRVIGLSEEPAGQQIALQDRVSPK
jgi:hypothetical protein